MNEVINQLVMAYVQTFDAYDVKDTQLKLDVDNYVKETLELANASNDPTQFLTDFASSGLQEKYTALITKVAMQNNVETAQQTTVESSLPSVKQFVEQYRTAYDEVCKAGYRNRAKNAYEQLLALGDEYDDLLDAQIQIEENSLLWEIVKQDLMDIHETMYKACDPLYDFMKEVLALPYEMVKNATSDEQLVYESQIMTHTRIALMKKEMQRLLWVNTLLNEMMNYIQSKIKIAQWNHDTEVMNYTKLMVASRMNVKKIIHFIESEYHISKDALFQEQQHRIWFLTPTPLDDLSRIKKGLHPQNIQVLQNILEEEIYSSLNCTELLKLEKDEMIYFALESDISQYFEKQAKQVMVEQNASITYFKFLQDSAFQQARSQIVIKK